MRPPRYGTDALRDPDPDEVDADVKRANLVNNRIMADYLRGMSLLDAAMQPPPADLSPRDPGDESDHADDFTGDNY